MAANWKSVGDHLSVPAHELDIIQENNRGGKDVCQACLRGMFEWWLNNGDNVTPEKLAEAVRAVGEHHLVDRINMKFGEVLLCKILIDAHQGFIHWEGREASPPVRSTNPPPPPGGGGGGGRLVLRREGGRIGKEREETYMYTCSLAPCNTVAMHCAKIKYSWQWREEHRS